MIRRLGVVGWVEWFGWVRHSSTYAVLAGVSVLLCLSVVLGARDLEARRETYRRQLADLAAAQVKQRLPLPGWAPEPVLRVIRPPELGSLLARADDGTVPAYFDFGPAGTVWARGVPTDEAPSQDGTLLDLESIVRVVGGFLAILMGVESFVTARDKGVLKGWAVLGTSPIATCAGKLIGCWTVMGMLAAVLFAVAIVAGAVSVRPDIETFSIIVARCLVPTFLYLATYTSIGALFALTLRPASGAVTAGVAFWITTSMVGPQVLTLCSRALAPTEGRVAMERQRDLDFESEVRAGEQAVGDAVVAKVGQMSSLETAAAIREHASEFSEVWLRHARAAREGAQSIEMRWNSARDRRERIESLGGFIGPGAPLRRAIAALAGTEGLSERWNHLVEDHQRILNTLLFDDRPQVTVRVPADQGRQLTAFTRRPAPQWYDLPLSPTSLATLPEPWEEAAPSIGALAVYLFLTLGCVAWAAKRLELYPS
jgi:ABC-type transport system involved in multi-copper enzyme maturation permease subunit